VRASGREPIVTINVYGVLPREQRVVTAALPELKLRFFETPPTRGTRGRLGVAWVSFMGHTRERGLRNRSGVLAVARGGIGELIRVVRVVAASE
jgi:hypothetical protein